MKRIVLVFILLTFAGCATINKQPSATDDLRNSPGMFLGYQPADPVPVEKVERFKDGRMENVFWASLPDDEKRKLLPIQSSQVFVQKTDVSGKVGYLTAAVSGARGSYTVFMDYMKYLVEDVHDNTGRFLGSAKTGVGLRVKATVVTNSADLNLGGLLNIGLEAKLGNLKGEISIDVVGIDSPDVINLVPLSSEIDQTSIQTALQALASIKAKIGDQSTTLTPHLIAFKQASEGSGEELKNQITIGEKRAGNFVRMKDEILSEVAPGNNLDAAKWTALVDSSTLSASQKTELRKLNDFSRVNARLEMDAAMNGRVITPLHAKLGSR